MDEEIASILEIEKAWDGPRLVLAGEKHTLNEIEHELLRKRFAEPRIHFALVCAATGCPPLRSEAYRADRLEEQLAEATRHFVRTSFFNRLDRAEGILYVSKIFEWYGEDFEDLTGHADGKVSAFVNILLGCNRRCTYCIVPEVRGREWSRPGRAVVEEVEGLAAAGVREVTLLGQSVMSYGRANEVWDDGPASPRGYREPLSRLLEAVASIDGVQRVRFTSGHPSGCTDELGRAIAELPETYRNVVLLRYYGQHSCNQIAKQLEIPLGTVTKQLSRAYAMLRQSLQRQEQAESLSQGD